MGIVSSLGGVEKALELIEKGDLKYIEILEFRVVDVRPQHSPVHCSNPLTFYIYQINSMVKIFKNVFKRLSRK